MQPMQTLYILDASGYIYRSYFAIQNMTNSKGESTNALYGFIRSVLKLFKDFNPHHLVAVYDGPRSIAAREAIFPDYKAHRKEMPNDLRHQIEWSQQFCDLHGIPKLNLTGVEADDTIGSVAKWAEQQGAKVFVCSSDKDLCQLVNQNISILNTHKDNLILGPEEIEIHFGVRPDQIVDYLALVGDSSDNIPGVPGFGPKTASELLKQFGSLDALLDHPESILGKKRQEIFIQNKENAILSRKLVTLHLDIEFPNDCSFFHLRSPRFTELKDFFKEMSFHSLIKELEQTAVQVEEELDYKIVQDIEDLENLLKILSEQSEIGLEVKTSSLHPLKGAIVGIGFSFSPQKAWYLPFNGTISKNDLLPKLNDLFKNPNISFFAHNAKAALHAFKLENLSPPKISFDTLLASYILNSQRKHTLENLMIDFFGKVKSPFQDISGKGKNLLSIEQIPIEKFGHFCCEEIDYISRLKGILQKQLEERNLQFLLEEIELPLTSILAEMEQRGIFLDAGILKEFSAQLNASLRNLEEEIYSLAGESFNLNSPKQLSGILFDKLGIRPLKKTATGLSTSAEVLESLKNAYPIVNKILEYRVLEKLRSTYVDSLPGMTHGETQRIHPTFTQYVTATGRLSCQDPNLQNIPIRTDIGRRIREAFKPEKPGWSFLAADYSQIELRILAHLSGDPTLIEAFTNGTDVHVHTASVMLNIPIDQVSKEQRNQAKTVNFGTIYGQQAFGLSQELKIDLKQASQFIQTYFSRYGKVREFLDSCKEITRKTGKSFTMIGRERIIPEIHNKNLQVRSAAERLAINTPIQGSAADLIKMAMIRIQKKIQEEHLSGFMILQIHDELIFEIPDQELDRFKKIVQEEMEGVVELKVPLIVDITIGKNWKEC